MYAIRSYYVFRESFSFTVIVSAEAVTDQKQKATEAKNVKTDLNGFMIQIINT